MTNVSRRGKEQYFRKVGGWHWSLNEHPKNEPPTFVYLDVPSPVPTIRVER